MGAVVSVICCSHTPGLMVPPEDWQRIYDHATAKRSLPWPADIARALEAETPEVNARQHRTCQKALDTLAGYLSDAKPDLVIMFGDDQNENFHVENMPPFCIFAGEESFGFPMKVRRSYWREDPGERVTVKGAPDIAMKIVTEGDHAGFDISWSTEFPDRQFGLPHSMIRLVRKLRIDAPMIPFHVNAFYEPAPSALRTYHLGMVLKSIIEKHTPQGYRVAIIGSGGLSHEPRGENAGYIDAAHDQWVLERVRAGDGESLSRLTNQDLLDAADHELRNWIVAMGCTGDRPPDYLEYVLAYRSLVGNGFAAWRLG